MKKYILPLITLIISIITTISVLKLNILPNKYLILFILGELVLLSLSSLQILKNKLLKIIGIIISILLILINIIGLYYVNKTNKFIKENFTGNIVYTSNYYVITDLENDKTIEEIENIEYYKYSYNIEEAKTKLGDYNYIEIENINETVKNLKDKYLLIDEYNLKLIEDNYKIIYEFNIEKTEQRNKTTNEAYNIYIGGRDFTRSLMDFNMIITINTKTKIILLTSIPRDYYIYVPDYKMNDSLEFMGLLGEKTIMNSLENLLETEINNYVSIYTEGLVEIVDKLGGIEFCSKETFTTTHAQVLDTYDDSKGEKLTIKEGCQTLNGIQTLTVARERKNVGSDRQRQKNCRQIFEKILEKSLSLTTLTNYEELLNSVSNLYQTNINKTTIQTLIKNIINNKYEIIEQSIDGTDGENYIRLNTVKSYVMYPDIQTVNNAKEKINQILNGR